MNHGGFFPTNKIEDEVCHPAGDDLGMVNMALGSLEIKEIPSGND